MLAAAPDGRNFTTIKEVLVSPSPVAKKVREAPNQLGVPIAYAISPPDLAIDGSDNLFITLLGYTDAEAAPFGDVFILKSSDGGRNFGSPVNVTTNTQYGRRTIYPSLVRDGDRGVGMLYTFSGQVLYRVSSDGGQTFSAAQSLSGVLPSIWYQPGVITNASGNVFAFWVTTVAGSTEGFLCKVR